MHADEARERLLDAAERLFYERGIQAVGMDQLRTASGVSLKRLYQCFPSKGDLVESCLRRRDERWRAALADHVSRHAGDQAERPLLVFDWLGEWFAEPGFRGCAFINAYSELAALSPGAAQAARDHKLSFLAYMTALVEEAAAVADLTPADPAVLARQLVLLADGAITTAAMTGDPAAARHARTAAETLLSAARTAAP
ncbi:TetR/AcrR family transcriptional regulator [Streptomyces albus]|uniref:TetR/AcrR family transcriptional regulator n=1 Tax=Streptomyces albus TaxID=1888 RepID=UPI0004C8D86B|nr:TetR/AcrR family transcriptional regulator [Streptomyces albus]